MKFEIALFGKTLADICTSCATAPAIGAVISDFPPKAGGKRRAQTFQAAHCSHHGPPNALTIEREMHHLRGQKGKNIIGYECQPYFERINHRHLRCDQPSLATQ